MPFTRKIYYLNSILASLSANRTSIPARRGGNDCKPAPSVLAEVSSMNTRRARSNRPCSRIRRRRARATSVRSCSPARKVFLKVIWTAVRLPGILCSRITRRLRPASGRALPRSAPAKSPRAFPAATCSRQAVWRQTARSCESVSPRPPLYRGSPHSVQLPPAATHHLLQIFAQLPAFHLCKRTGLNNILRAGCDPLF
jgi:hypothetical protein